MVLKSSLDDH